MIAAIALDELGVLEEDYQKVLDKIIKAAVIMVAKKLSNTPCWRTIPFVCP